MNAAAGASFQAVVSSGVSLLTLWICASLCFVLEVAPVALVEAPLLLFSFNLRTAGERQDITSSLVTLEEAAWLHSGLQYESRSIGSQLGGQKHAHSVSLRVCIAARCKHVSTCLASGAPDGQMGSWTDAQ